MLENIANIVTILGLGSEGVGALKFLQDHKEKKEKKEADKVQKELEKLVLLATMRNAITTFSSNKHDDLDDQRYAQDIDGEKKFIQWPMRMKGIYTI